MRSRDTDHTEEEEEVDLFQCFMSWQYGLAGDHSSRWLSQWQVQFGVKLLLWLPVGSMLPFVLTWSPWWYWVPSVWFCRVYCFLNGLLGWRVSIAVTLDPTLYLHKVWSVTGSHFVNPLHINPISKRVSPTGMPQIYHLDDMLYMFRMYISA